MKNENKAYCVYKHTSPNGKIYIGITAQKPERRWQNGHGYMGNSHFTNAIRKYGWNNFKHEIIDTNLSYIDACKKEKFYISKYNTTDDEYGYNILEGGEAIKSTPVKMYLIDGTFVNRFESIAEASTLMNIYDGSISNAISGLSKTAGGYLWTKDNIDLDIESIPQFTDLELAKLNKIKIKQYNTNGDLIRIFDSLEEIRKILKVPPSAVFKVCIGKLNNTHNYVWRFEFDDFNKYIDNFKIVRNNDTSIKLVKMKNRKYENIPIFQYNFDGTLNAIYKDIYCIAPVGDWRYSHIVACLNYEEDSCDGYVYRFNRDLRFEKSGYQRNALRTKVVQFDFCGNRLATYNSVTIAEKESGATNISLCISGERHQSGGYIWRREGDRFDKYPLEKNLKTRPVCQYEKNGQLVKEYKSIAEAERSLGIHNIQKGVKRICKTIGGYIWRYKDDTFD